MTSVNTRDAIHALVDDLDESELDRAREALEQLRAVQLSEEDLRELMARDAACERGEGIDFDLFLAKLRGAPPDSNG